LVWIYDVLTTLIHVDTMVRRVWNDFDTICDVYEFETRVRWFWDDCETILRRCCDDVEKILILFRTYGSTVCTCVTISDRLVVLRNIDMYSPFMGFRNWKHLNQHIYPILRWFWADFERMLRGFWENLERIWRGFCSKYRVFGLMSGFTVNSCEVCRAEPYFLYFS
jgi:hypothetical protein